MNPEYVGWDVVVLVGLVLVMVVLAFVAGIGYGAMPERLEMGRMHDAIVDRDRKIYGVERERDEAEAELVRLGGGVREVEGQQERRVM
jgi:hypothetical protein